jgi:uncharacterized protein YndB with AHSA1/START domain
MANIIQEFTVKAAPPLVMEMFTMPEGLDRWWTKGSAGAPKENAEYTLHFGPEYDWRAKVTRFVPDREFELQMTQAHEDWKGTRVGCTLTSDGHTATRVFFYHKGWPQENEHWRVSCYCWAMYLRLLRRNLEYGETVPYEKRLEV